MSGIRQFREENGPGSGQRVIHMESGGGLVVELLPDRTCDIGRVWCDGVPFGWIGPIGTGAVPALGANTPLSGLMTTCGFDHIRQPVTDEGRAYPQHGSMMHQPATVVAAGPVDGGLRVVAEATQFNLDRGAVRLRRTIDVPLGGRGFALVDEVTVIAGALPLMAMYHVNLGLPFADGVLTLNGADVTAACFGADGVRTRPVGQGTAVATLAAGASRFTLGFDADALPVFQTFRVATPGIDLACIEPASHDRLSRESLRAAGALEPAVAGTTRRFALDFGFESGLRRD